MTDYKHLGFDSKLRKLDSIALKPRPESGYQLDSQTERGAVRKLHATELYTLSNAGTVSTVELGAAGSGTETLIVTSTLANKRPRTMLFATHEFSFYQGTATVGTARLFGATSSVPYSNYVIMHWNDWGASDQYNMVAQDVCRNTTAGTVGIMLVNQWRFIVPAGGAA